MPRWGLLPLLLVALIASARADDQPRPSGAVAHLLGGGAARGDCLAGLEVMGLSAAARARTVTCRDGDASCDHDHLVNGRCEFWTRICLNMTPDCSADGVAEVAVDGAGDDPDLAVLSRTLELVQTPSATPGTCGALTTVTVPLGTRANGSRKKGRKHVAWHALAGAARDVDGVTFLCQPPARDKRKGGISFDVIQKRIFEKSCAFSGCHGVDNPQAALVLTGADVYDHLVDRLAHTAVAQYAGRKLVVPGAADTSFLLDKLLGRLQPGEGAPMPFQRASLRADQIDAIRTWILAGAPRERVIKGGLAGLADRQPRVEAPAVPAGGYQVHMAPVVLGDRPEIEGCQYARLGNTEDIDVEKIEFLMHPGSHHFILTAYRCADDDHDGVNDCDAPDFDSRFPTGFAPCEQFGSNWAFLSGSQTPQFLVDYQTAATGVAVQLHKNQPVRLNSHYVNAYADTMAEVWVGVTPVDPALVSHPARILFEVVANAFIQVPPGTRNKKATYHTCAFVDPATDPVCQGASDVIGGNGPAGRFALLAVTSHMHKRSKKFVADLFAPDGTRVERDADITDTDDGSKHLYVSRQYDDPLNMSMWPPIMVEQGQQLVYTCYHDNGVTQPVRLGCEETPGVPPGRSILQNVLDGKGYYGGAARWCRTDADCAGFGTGRCVPANLVFGELADDDMCILPGLYYPCPTDGSPCVECRTAGGCGGS